MDTKDAQFILSSYRPDGRDAQDKDFAEALALAAENRELGEWLAKERAQDAAFSAALNTIEIPESLRDDIYMALHQVEPEPDEFDDLFGVALADVKPPADLRDQILAAMEQEVKTQTPDNVVQASFGINKLLPIAAAIVIAIGAVFIFGPFGQITGGSIAGDVINKHNTKAKNIQMDIGTQIKDNVVLTSLQTDESIDWLKERQLPTFDIPERIKQFKCKGVTPIELKNGSQASLIRFMTKDNKEVNMLMINKKDVSDSQNMPVCPITSRNDSYYCPKCDYAIARMQSDDVVVILLSQLDQDETAQLF